MKMVISWDLSIIYDIDETFNQQTNMGILKHKQRCVCVYFFVSVLIGSHVVGMDQNRVPQVRDLWCIKMPECSGYSPKMIALNRPCLKVFQIVQS